METAFSDPILQVFRSAFPRPQILAITIIRLAMTEVIILPRCLHVQAEVQAGGEPMLRAKKRQAPRTLLPRHPPLAASRLLEGFKDPFAETVVRFG